MTVGSSSKFDRKTCSFEVSSCSIYPRGMYLGRPLFHTFCQLRHHVIYSDWVVHTEEILYASTTSCLVPVPFRRVDMPVTSFQGPINGLFRLLIAHLVDLSKPTA